MIKSGSFSVDGKEVRFKLWWPIKLLAYIDVFFSTLIGKGDLSFKSTQILVMENSNTHTAERQCFSIVMIDADNQKNMIWGVDLTPDQGFYFAQNILRLVINKRMGQGSFEKITEKAQKISETMEKET